VGCLHPVFGSGQGGFGVCGGWVWGVLGVDGVCLGRVWGVVGVCRGCVSAQFGDAVCAVIKVTD